MTDVNVEIDGIVMYCDESISNLSIGNGYILKKVYLDDIPFKNKITDANGNVNIGYIGSQLRDDNGIYFMCIHKQDCYSIEGPSMEFNKAISDRDMMCENELAEYKDQEIRFMHKMIALLRLFKSGNIGFKEVFFKHTFQLMGFIHQTSNQTSTNATRNIIDDRVYFLTAEELIRCNSFLQNYSGVEYDLLSECIEEFVWGLEQIDIPTGFEQYTTALEMILLEQNQQGKKEALSKRVSVLLENDAANMRTLYNKMKNFYRYRSESLHEGNGQNITQSELEDLENIVRLVLVKYLEFCKTAVNSQPSITWSEIKTNKIRDLKNDVVAAKAAGILPE